MIYRLFILLLLPIIGQSDSTAIKPALYYQYSNNGFVDRGCHDRLVGILIGRSGYVTSRNFVYQSAIINNLTQQHLGNEILMKNISQLLQYPANEFCQWMIKATPGSRIRLRFTSFDVEPGKHCAYDNVSIWQVLPSPNNIQVTDSSRQQFGGVAMKNNTIAHQSLLGVFCGSSMPPIIESAVSSSLLVVFQSDTSISRPGFRLVWETFSTEDPLEQACNMKDGEAVVLNGPQGIIQLNHFDGRTPYSPNLKCVWKVQLPVGKVVRLRVEHLDLESSKDCTFDSLEIYDGGYASLNNRLGRYCGENGHPFLLTSTWNEMLIKFKSDNSTEKAGFRLKWQEIALNGFLEMGCWQTRPALIQGRPTGALHLPGYDGTTFYEPNMDCKWYISAKNHTFLRIKFTALSTEREEKGCFHDRLSFSHPGSLFEPMIFCGDNLPSEVITWKSSELLVEFKSDDSIQSTGFRFEWTESLQDDEIETSQPSTTPITTIPSSTPAINAKLRQSFGTYEPNHQQNEGMNLPPSSTLMPQEGVAAKNGSGLPQFYSCQTPRRYFYSRAGKLSSPGFGLTEYPMFAHCSYVITVPNGHFVRLNFTAFETEYSNNCENDYVAIYEGESEQNKTIAKLCGTLPPGKLVESTGSRLLVVFHSNNETSLKGFSATFAAVHLPNYAEAGCWFGEDEPAVIAADSGVLASRNFDGVRPYMYHQRCAWRIKTNETSRIRIKFAHFSLESSSTGCAGDTLAIYDGSNKMSPVLGVFCGIAIPPPISSSGNNLFITFTTDDRVEKTGFRLEWHSVPNLQVIATTTPLAVVTEQLLTNATTTNLFGSNSDLLQRAADVKILANSIVQASWPGYVMPPTDTAPYQTEPPTDTPNIPPGVRRILGMDQQLQIGNKVQQAIMRSAKLHQFSGSSHPSSSKEQFSSAMRRLPFFSVAPLQSSSLYPGIQQRSSENLAVRKIDPALLMSLQHEKVAISNPTSVYRHQYVSRTTRPPMYFVKTMESFATTEMSSTTSSTSAGIPTTTASVIRDECLAIYGLTDEDSVLSSFYGTCENGNIKVLTSRKAANPGGVITSGNFDRLNMYPMLQNCVWSIRAPPGFRISVTFLHFDLERGRDNTCPYDRVEFWDGPLLPNIANNELGTTLAPKTFSSETSVGNVSNEIGQFCGLSPRKQPIVSSGSALTLRFVSDSVVQRTGFCLKWSAHPVESELLIAEEVGRRNEHPNHDSSFIAGGGEISANEPSGCGGPKYMSRGSGHIKSPNYGKGPYYPNLDCRWVVAAPPGKIVRVNLIDVDIEPDVRNCRYDYLALFDGASEYAAVIKRLCGRPRPSIVKTTSNTVYLQFRTDGTAEGKGFLIEYSFTDPPT